MDRATDLRTLVSNLKNAAYDEQVHILQMLGDKLINDCRIEVFGVTIEPLWVEAYCYDETHFPDHNTHRSRKQKNRFGQMYFHERGYGGLDICLSNSEDFCLSFLLKATLANGRFLTQTQLPRVLLSTGKTKADFEHLEDILHPANARHTICHTTRVNLAKPCYSDAPLTSFALDAIPKYDFRFARKKPSRECTGVPAGLYGRASRLYRTRMQGRVPPCVRMGARPGADMGAQLMCSLLLLRLPQEQHTQGAGAAV